MSTDYVTFTSTGIKVDLTRFLKTDAGKALLKKLEEDSKRFEKPCPNCGSPTYTNYPKISTQGATP